MPLEAEPFEWGWPTVQIWCFKLLHNCRYIDFHTSHLGDFEQFKIDSQFADFGQIKIDCPNLLSLTLGRLELFYWNWGRC